MEPNFSLSEDGFRRSAPKAHPVQTVSASGASLRECAGNAFETREAQAPLKIVEKPLVGRRIDYIQGYSARFHGWCRTEDVSLQRAPAWLIRYAKRLDTFEYWRKSDSCRCVRISMKVKEKCRRASHLRVKHITITSKAICPCYEENLRKSHP